MRGWLRPQDQPRQEQATPKCDQGASRCLTDYVAGFVVDTESRDIPKDVAHLGKRSVLDGIGLALAGAASDMRPHRAQYLESLGIVSDRRQHA